MRCCRHIIFNLDQFGRLCQPNTYPISESDMINEELNKSYYELNLKRNKISIKLSESNG